MHEDFYSELSYTEFSKVKGINVIPEQDFKRLVRDTFVEIANVLRTTYGPYGTASSYGAIGGETTTTKDGYNTFMQLAFSNRFKQLVLTTVRNIIERVNRNVGDGTTSCILLAYEIFQKLSELIKTPDDNRNIMNLLTHVEDRLMNTINDKSTQPLTIDTMKQIIRLASNDDDDIIESMVDALDAQCDENGIVKSIRHVISDQNLTGSTSSIGKYKIDKLPGNYRIGVRIRMDDAPQSEYRERYARVVLYDHAMNKAGWSKFIKNFNKSKELKDTVIIARGYAKEVLEVEYANYIRTISALKKEPNIFLYELNSSDYGFQVDIKDLSKVLNVVPESLNALNDLDHDELPVFKVGIYNESCVCFDLPETNVPTEYIDSIKFARDNDKSGSITARYKYNKRIDDLTLKGKETLITVTGTSLLDLRLSIDKINDCIAIVNSALNTGVVPNLFRYGYEKITTELADYEADKELASRVSVALHEAIQEMFTAVWVSKYSDTRYDEMMKTIDEFYKGETNQSFDIVKNEFVDMCQLPTSTQYDSEVIASAISIVKYLITSKVFIFDASLLPRSDLY